LEVALKTLLLENESLKKKLENAEKNQLSKDLEEATSWLNNQEKENEKEMEIPVVIIFFFSFFFFFYFKKSLLHLHLSKLKQPFLLLKPSKPLKNRIL
jgi:hypothetical protein